MKAVPPGHSSGRNLLSVVDVVSLVTVTLLKPSPRRRESLGEGGQFLVSLLSLLSVVVVLLLLLLLLWRLLLVLMMIMVLRLIVVEVHGSCCLGQEVAEGWVRGQRGVG